MTTIKNNHTGPLVVQGVTIQPGETADVPDFSTAAKPVIDKETGAVKQGSPALEAWLKAGVISEVSGKKSKSDDDDAEAAEAKAKADAEAAEAKAKADAEAAEAAKAAGKNKALPGLPS